MLRRLTRAVETLRPKAVAQMASRLARLTADHNELAELTRQHVRASERQQLTHARAIERAQATLAAQAGTEAALTARIGELTAQLSELQNTLTHVSRRTDQVAVAAERLVTDEALAPLVDGVLDADKVRTHVHAVLDRTPLELDPYPYMVLDNLLPTPLYNALIATMPPTVLFEDGSVNKQRLKIPPKMAGAATFRLWHFLVTEIVEGCLEQALLQKFHDPLTEYARRFWPSVSLKDLRLHSSDGRIILRRRGYVIPPHRDPKWAWLTFILYLARPGDPDTWGTQIYRVSDDVEAPGAQPFWMQAHDNVLAKDVRFIANRALVFLNADHSHGASIPEEAPEDFERYIYQFRVGPVGQTIERLKSELTPEARAKWEGKDGY